MSLENSLALTLTCFIVMVTPGPGILGLIGHTMGRGLRRSIGFIIGMVCGDLVFLVLVMLGLAVLAKTFENTFLVIRMFAAGYLVYLGISAWRASPHQPDTIESNSNGHVHGFFSGLLMTLSNPKVTIFYIGILPGFIDLTLLNTLDALKVIAIVLGVLIVVVLSYAVAAARARAALNSPGTRKLINRGSGLVMIGAGITIAIR